MCWAGPSGLHSSVTEGQKVNRYSRSVLFRIRRFNSRLTADQLRKLSENRLLRYRGSRGRGRKLSREQAKIRVVTGHRPERPASAQRAGPYTSLRRIELVSYNETRAQAPPLNGSRDPPALYVLNAAALSKPHAIEQLTADLIGYHVDIAAITESHFKPKHTDDIVAIAGYSLFRRDRLGRRGGGVAIYVNLTLRAVEWTFSGDNLQFELLWIKVNQPSRPTAFFGALYHPPKSLYIPQILLDYIDESIEEISTTFPGSLIVLAGDMNQLSSQDISDCSGLALIIDQPTRGASRLDRIYASDPHCYSNIKVLKSAVKSDHSAILAYNGELKQARDKTSTLCTYRRKSPAQNASFLAHTQHVAIPPQQETVDRDVQSAFDSFYATAYGLLDQFYPERTVSLTSREPSFMNPELKADLRRRNKLMRAGRVEEANALSDRIGRDITRHNTAEFQNCSARIDAKDLWSKVRQLSNRGSGRSVAVCDVTAAELNDHYANISRDRDYVLPDRKLCVSSNTNYFSVWQVFYVLDHLHSTATGLDNLPAWFLRLGAPFFAEPLTKLFNMSIQESVVPSQWKRASILPIPKVPRPSAASDFRPISITPVLSRIMERFVVQQFIYPALIYPSAPLHFSDQFAFRPTGSTTAALITLLQTITTLLTTNPYVLVYALDFSKAFDTVRHATLFDKLATLRMPDEVFNWITEFFYNHSHCTKFGGKTSAFADINASVIQGSALGPASYLVNAADLRPVHDGNVLVKFADDTYLIVPARSNHTAESELKNVESWAEVNNLRLNPTKTMEIVFYNPDRKKGRNEIPPVRPGVARVDTITALGVELTNNFSMRMHVDSILTACNQTLFALRTLRAHGLSHDSLQTIFMSIAVGKLRYAAPAWFGFSNAEDRERLEAFLRKSKRAGYCPSDAPSFSSMCASADAALFASMRADSHHVLHHLLPPKAPRSYSLRPRTHDLVIPHRTSALADKNFLTRMLFTGPTFCK